VRSLWFSSFYIYNMYNKIFIIYRSNYGKNYYNIVCVYIYIMYVRILSVPSVTRCTWPSFKVPAAVRMNTYTNNIILCTSYGSFYLYVQYNNIVPRYILLYYHIIMHHIILYGFLNFIFAYVYVRFIHIIDWSWRYETWRE